jgi:hypothetical protein
VSDEPETSEPEITLDNLDQLEIAAEVRVVLTPHPNVRQFHTVASFTDSPLPIERDDLEALLESPASPLVKQLAAHLFEAHEVELVAFAYHAVHIQIGLMFDWDDPTFESVLATALAVTLGATLIHFIYEVVEADNEHDADTPLVTESTESTSTDEPS